MLVLPTLLVLFAGLVHASWNLVSKTTRAGADFVILYSSISCLLYAPVALYSAHTAALTFRISTIWIVALSGLLHFAYAVVLQTGYQRADLAIIYPTARGAGPLLASCAAVLLLNERLFATEIAGALLIAIGIGLVGTPTSASANDDRDRTLHGLMFGVGTGAFIASYTIVDAIAVKTAGLPPVLLDYLSNLVRTGILLPAMVARRTNLYGILKTHPRACVLVALLSPLSYVVVLYAMRMAPVSHIAPMREVSVLFGVLGAAVFLGEPFGWKRVVGAIAVATGIALLTNS